MSHQDVLTARYIRRLIRGGLDTVDITKLARMDPSAFPALKNRTVIDGDRVLHYPITESEVWNALARGGLRLVQNG